MSSVKKVAIIGAGVIGTTVAFRLLDQFKSSVSITIFSEKLSPDTTGDVSAGLWGPHILGNTPERKILEWAKNSHDFFHKLWKSPEAANAGVSLLSCTRVRSDLEGYNDPWKDIPFGYRDLSAKELELLSMQRHRNYKTGVQYITFACEPTRFLPYLYKYISNAGGRIECKRINSFDELTEFDVVINCTGIGAKQLVKSDSHLMPVRGQVIRCKAAWIYEATIEDSHDENYMIPNMETIVLGGTHQENNHSLNVDVNDKRSIYDGCVRLNASLKRAEIVADKVGLRPARTEVRLERETYTTNIGKKLQIIHNYGHGGSGVTLSYGCAVEVANIVNDILKLRPDLKSKL